MRRSGFIEGARRNAGTGDYRAEEGSEDSASPTDRAARSNPRSSSPRSPIFRMSRGLLWVLAQVDLARPSVLAHGFGELLEWIQGDAAIVSALDVSSEVCKVRENDRLKAVGHAGLHEV
jgi:hypothetical protein